MLRVALFGIALASGGVAAWLVGTMQPTEARTADSPNSIPMVEVLVASSDIEQGVQVREDQLLWQTWPQDAVQSAFILRTARPEAIEKLAGSVVRGNVTKGEPIVDKKLAPANSNFLAAVLSPGMRAVAIAVSAERTAGGFILPNDRVDVLLALPCRPEDGCASHMNVKTILKNVRVLAIGQSGETSSDAVQVGKTATLELDPAQSETIVGAEASGTLSLVLRAATDNNRDLNSSPETRRTMRVLRGGVSEYVTIR